MMGRTHAATGAAAGALIAPHIDASGVAMTALVAVSTGGYALLADLDHPNATASRLLGPITWLLSKMLRGLSSLTYRATRTSDDRDTDGTHRHLSHTVVFALVLGAATTTGIAYGGPWVAAAVAALGVLLFDAVFGDWVLPVALAAGVWWWREVGDPLAALAETGPLWGITVAAGCIVHCLGDAVTKSGCPFLFPLRIRGEAWYEIGPPQRLRFRTGGPVEKRLVFPVTALATAAALIYPFAFS